MVHSVSMNVRTKGPKGSLREGSILSVLSAGATREGMRSSDYAFLTCSAAVISHAPICNKKGRLEDGAARGAEWNGTAYPSRRLFVGSSQLNGRLDAIKFKGGGKRRRRRRRRRSGSSAFGARCAQWKKIEWYESKIARLPAVRVIEGLQQ